MSNIHRPLDGGDRKSEASSNQSDKVEVVRFRMGLIDPSDSIAADALELEARVFSAIFGNTEAELREEYQPWLARSHIVEMRSAEGELVAMLRASWANSPNESLKTLDDGASAFGADAERFIDEVGGVVQVVDVLTIAATGDAQGLDGRSIAGSMLLAAIYLSGRLRGCTHLVTLVDEIVETYMRTEFLMPFRPLPGAVAAPYLGSTSSIPSYVDLREAAEAATGDLRAIIEGRGLSVGVEVEPGLLKHVFEPEPAIDLTESSASASS